MCAITRATIADAESIARLLAEAFASYRALYTPAGFAATTPTAEVIASRMHEGPTWISGSVATLSAIAKGKDLYLRSMAVHPRVRGRGIGAQLLEIAERFAHDHGYGDLVLSTTPFLDRAIALYEHYGFVRTVEPPDDLFGTPLFTMRKTIQTR